ncbi:hypothetical protein CBS63078_676 [Aspergillus niger]|nr:hypothetical protein CBS63078_676 [Aspergillus niger]KAI2977142.1 hypothetical protein CBS147323_152 [Aspergillus niger]KAI2988863.1 hypothetical protein CBS147345_10681 [Aspergillus niger]KAI3028379.1 hypothetical protein CBS147347_4103 [Aspergillus niger]KAI3088264.1 hypothetical protein CBS147353_171 [Aspergillus niger]
MDTYIRWKENNRLPDTPPLVVELDGSSILWTEKKETYSFNITLRIVLDNQQFWLRWSSFIDPSKEDYILLSHDPESSNVERIGIEEHSRYPLSLPTLHQFPNEPASFYVEEAKKNWDRSKLTMRVSLPNTWAKLVEPGRIYTLLWTGKEIPYWDWGTPQQKMETKPNRSPIVIPGGAHLTFTVQEGRPPPIPSPPTPPPIDPSERVPGAPVLSLELICSSTMHPSGNLEMSIKVTYHGPSAVPITFHTWAFNPFDAFSVYRRISPEESTLGTEKEWKTCIGDRSAHVFWDNPDRQLNVAENEEDRFTSLFPGESWSDSWSLPADGDCRPEDARPGEQLRYQFTGNTLDWWDWGTIEDHAQTIVTLPGSGIEPIKHPKDNDGRPKVVIPASNILEWTVPQCYDSQYH